MSAVQFGSCPLRFLHHDGGGAAVADAVVVVDGDGGGVDDDEGDDDAFVLVGDFDGAAFRNLFCLLTHWLLSC